MGFQLAYTKLLQNGDILLHYNLCRMITLFKFQMSLQSIIELDVVFSILVGVLSSLCIL